MRKCTDNHLKTNEEDTRLVSRKFVRGRWDCSTDFLRERERVGDLTAIILSSRCLRYRLSEIEEFERTRMAKN